MGQHFLSVLLCLLSVSGAALAEETAKPVVENHTSKTAGEKSEEQKEPNKKKKLPEGWRCDPKIKRHPGSYIGFGAAYSLGRAWFRPQEDEFNEPVEVGPVHGWQSTIRVGDAFFEWFAVGFQIDIANTIQKNTNTMAAFGLLLDTTFYPWRGLGIRPSVGLGFSYAVGEYDFEIGYGGPLDLSFALTYEFRLNRLFVIAPVAQVYWMKGDDYNSVFFSFGLELLKWFDTPTG